MESGTDVADILHPPLYRPGSIRIAHSEAVHCTLYERLGGHCDLRGTSFMVCTFFPFKIDNLLFLFILLIVVGSLKGLLPYLIVDWHLGHISAGTHLHGI